MWMFNLGPRYIPYDAREELAGMAFIMKQRRFLDEIWRLRRVEHYKPARKARSLSWPVSCFDTGLRGYVLAQDRKPTVIQMRGRGK